MSAARVQFGWVVEYAWVWCGVKKFGKLVKGLGLLGGRLIWSMVKKSLF